MVWITKNLMFICMRKQFGWCLIVITVDFWKNTREIAMLFIFGIRYHNTSGSSSQYTEVSYIGIIPLTLS